MSLFGRKEPWCLVLGGGGAKGVYHVGVWRALKELKVPVNAFVGNSIGAVVAAFLAQGLDRKIEEIAETITVDFVVDIPDELVENGEIKIDPGRLPRFKTFYRGLWEKKGIDTSPFRKLLETHLDEDVVRRSGNDLGVVTYNLTDFKPREVYIETMEPGRMIDYLMASSAVPGFVQPEIEGKKYADGGLYDNIPYTMARRRGYRRIIVVDIAGLGVNRPARSQGTTTVFIKNSIDMGGILDFNREFLDAYRELGYLDTLRTLDRLHGYRYFLEPDSRLESRFSRHLADRGGPPPDGAFPDEMKYDRRHLLKILECAASALELPRIRRFTYRDLVEAIEEATEVIESRVRSFAATENGAERLEALVRGASKGRVFDECPWYYHRLGQILWKDGPPRVLKGILEGLFPHNEGAQLYFDLVRGFLSPSRISAPVEGHG